MRKGFTLIELLIVVAIIAILAAIAVPNFLEAQTRSRVARVENDLRTMALAMESYYVDNGGYIPQSIDSPISKGTLSHADKRLLTTPISYLSVVPSDIYRALAGVTSGPSYSVYAVGYTSTGSPSYGTYPHTGWMTWSYGPDLLSQTSGFRTLKQVLANEAMDIPSIGTATATAFGVPTTGTSGNGMRYDPTNGTISIGEIFRFEGKANVR